MKALGSFIVSFFLTCFDPFLYKQPRKLENKQNVCVTEMKNACTSWLTDSQLLYFSLALLFLFLLCQD